MNNQDQYEKWAAEVAPKLIQARGTSAGVMPNDEQFEYLLAGAFRGIAIEALENAEAMLKKSVRNEKDLLTKKGIVGARMLLQALVISIKAPAQAGRAS